jgi:uncharacterized protein with PhoU and TrkA domain
LDLRRNEGVHVVVIKRATDADHADNSHRRVCLPSPGEPLLDTDVLVLLGEDGTLQALAEYRA